MIEPKPRGDAGGWVSRRRAQDRLNAGWHRAGARPDVAPWVHLPQECLEYDEYCRDWWWRSPFAEVSATQILRYVASRDRRARQAGLRIDHQDRMDWLSGLFTADAATATEAVLLTLALEALRQ
jgi:hypothetical protein